MSTDTSTAFNSAAAPASAPQSQPTAPAPVTPSAQVAGHQHGLQGGPPPPGSTHQVVANQMHREGMGKDEARSDGNNNYARPKQSTASQSRIDDLAKKFEKKAQQPSAEKTVQKNREQDRER